MNVKNAIKYSGCIVAIDATVACNDTVAFDITIATTVLHQSTHGTVAATNTVNIPHTIIFWTIGSN